MKGVIAMLVFIKIKNFSSAKDNVKRMRIKQQTRRKYLQKTHLIKDSYLKYSKDLKTQQ